MYEFLKYTAVKMIPLKAYGVVHITYLVIGVLLSIIISKKLKSISIKSLNKILFTLGVFLLITELYKQLFYTYYIGQGLYQWWIFPFQLCSIPMYFCLLIPFIKNKKVSHSIYIFLMSYNFLGGFISFLEPSGLIHEYVSLTVHAFLWHMILVFIGFLITFNKNIKKEKKDFKYSIYLYFSLCLIAFIINNIFNKVSSNDINMFFVGPNPSSIIVFKDISLKYGWFINDILFIGLMTLGSYIIYRLFIKRNLTKM